MPTGRKRKLVQVRTSLINSLQGIISRNCGCKLSSSKIKQFGQDNIAPLLVGQEDLQLSGTVSKETIEYLTMQIKKI